MPRTAAAVLLGLSAVTIASMSSIAACGGETGGGGNGGDASSMSSSSEMQSAAAYGVAVTSTTSGGQGGQGGGAAPAYGVAQTDSDGDGFFAENDDCNDNDANINPKAAETKGDTIDSNCNGDDDT